ncbi:MAG: DNA polymerase elongation subunit, partial [Candidatus Aenigmarchaeota archaeon]|nr:DNA polymerase elongation subunit [Candidatus Aenigmarchaeota archaeon]
AAEGEGTTTVTVLVDKALRVKGITAVEKEVDAPRKTLAVDIECVATQAGRVPEAGKDPVIMIALAFSPAYQGAASLVLSTRPGEGVRVSDTEAEMLQEFIGIVQGYDPDVLTGFNINNFDLPYILDRMRATGVKPLFGRCATKYAVARKVGNRFKGTVTGRVIVDSFEIVKKDFSLQRYSLDFVSGKLLGKHKEKVKHSEIEKLWKGGNEGYNLLVAYARKDAELALELVEQLQLLDKYIAIAKVAGTLLQDTLEGGETARIENILLREFNREGFVFPCKPEDRQVAARDAEKEQHLVGGYVIEPDKKLHANVVVLDFKSMYPSIIRSFNICPTTLSPEGEIVSPSGAKFLAPAIRKGIVPRVLEQLMNERAAVKKKLRRAEGDKRRVLYAKQWALKILANAFYGYLGYSRARVFDINVANSVTSYGREIIRKTADTIQTKHGYRVVYGDTDSVFVVIPEEDMEQLAAKGADLAKTLSKELPGIMELEFEKVFKRFLPLTKKRYAAWRFVQAEKDGKLAWEEEIETKGIETVRRDWCDLVSDTIGDVIDLVLKKNDIKVAVQHFKDIVGDLVTGKIPLQKLVVTKTMTKMPANYVGMQPHIELVKKMQVRSPDEAPGLGDRVPYVIVKGTELLSKRAEDPTYVLEKGLQIDSSYYIENQLLPPLERIFAALNISKSELLGNGRQMGIMESIRHHAAAQVVAAPEIAAADLTGFTCEKCAGYFASPPLLGACTCGGRLLFASRKGAGERLLVN